MIIRLVTSRYSPIKLFSFNLAAVALDKTGTKVATASEKGTVIRIFSVPSGTYMYLSYVLILICSLGKRLYEFRRGVARCAMISSLSFSSDATFLTVSSNTQTIHVFKLGAEHHQVHYFSLYIQSCL